MLVLASSGPDASPADNPPAATTPTASDSAMAASRDSLVKYNAAMQATRDSAARAPAPVPQATPYVGCPQPTGVAGRVDEYGYITIGGKIKNVSGATYRYVSVRYNLYDAQGNRIGDAMTNVLGLGAGESWRFSATSMQTGAKQYSLGDVTCY